VVITVDDLRRLLGTTSHPHTVALPTTIHVVDTLHAALDNLDVTLAHRNPHAAARHDATDTAVVLIATAPRPGTPTTRMQRLLTAGHRRRVCAILLGDYPTPTRVTVAPDATAAVVTGPLPPQLAGARLFTVPRHDALDLLTALTRPTDPSHTLTATDESGEVRAHGVDAADAADNPPASNVEDATIDNHAGDADDHDVTALATNLDGAPSQLSLRTFGRLTLAHSPETHGDNECNPAFEPDIATRDLAGTLSERSRELLICLALHPGGIHGDTLSEYRRFGIGPDDSIETVDASLTRLRADLTTLTGHPMHELIDTSADGHHRLNPDLITVDYHRFTTALAAHQRATNPDERAAARAMLESYGGDLAPDVCAEWIEAPRRHAARTAITAALNLAEHLEHHDGPDQAVALLEHAIAVIDPYNEAPYAQLIRLHRGYGRPDAALRTFAALVTALATIDATPSPDITALL
jgi:hypothetical protein